MDEVKKLAALARLSITDDEIERFSKEFEGILSYISKIEKSTVTIHGNTVPSVRNVFREDGTPHEEGKYTDALTAQFPAKDGTSLKVKQIISHD